MSGPKRTLLERRHRPVLTEEMVALYRRGREIVAAGADLRWEGNGGRRDEFLEISKRLEWTLLRRHPHEVSVFDDLSGEPPEYMQRRNTPAFPDFNGWHSGKALQTALEAAAGPSPAARAQGRGRRTKPRPLSDRL